MVSGLGSALRRDSASSNSPMVPAMPSFTGSVLTQSGINTVQPGETLELRVGPGHKRPHVTEVLSLHPSTATAAPLPRPNSR